MFEISINERRNIESADKLTKLCRQRELDRKRLKSTHSNAYYLDMDNRKLPPPTPFQTESLRSACQKNRTQEVNLAKAIDYISLQKGIHNRLQNKEKEVVRTRSAKFQNRAQLRKVALETELAKYTVQDKSLQGGSTDEKTLKQLAPNEEKLTVSLTKNTKNSRDQYKQKFNPKIDKSNSFFNISSDSDDDEDVFSEISESCSTISPVDLNKNYTQVHNDAIILPRSFHKLGSFSRTEQNNKDTDNTYPGVKRPNTVANTNRDCMSRSSSHKPRPKSCSNKFVSSWSSCRATNLVTLRAELRQMKEMRKKVKKEEPTIDFYLTSEKEKLENSLQKVHVFCDVIRQMNKNKI